MVGVLVAITMSFGDLIRHVREKGGIIVTLASCLTKTTIKYEKAGSV